MPRPASGSVVVDTRGDSPIFRLRFRNRGRRECVTLGSANDGWDRKRAEDQLRFVLADVERGIWRPPDRAPRQEVGALTQDPTFHEFASRWYHDREAALAAKTREDYQWRLITHLLPWFSTFKLREISVQEVDAFKAAKLREGVLGPSSINKLIGLLSAILEVAAEYGLIDKNPASGRRRKLKAPKPTAVWLDNATAIEALIGAAGTLDAQANRGHRHIHRKAMLSTLVFAGLRLAELRELRWRDVDLSAGTITVRESKTNAGVRRVELLPVLRRILAELPRGGPDQRVFGTTTGAAHSPSNIRRRVLEPAVRLANEQLERDGDVPLPSPLTPHKLRHSYASILVAIGTDPASVMALLGHGSASFSLGVYSHCMRRDPASRQALRDLVGAADWATTGNNVVTVDFAAVAAAR